MVPGIRLGTNVLCVVDNPQWSKRHSDNSLRPFRRGLLRLNRAPTGRQNWMTGHLGVDDVPAGRCRFQSGRSSCASKRVERGG